MSAIDAASGSRNKNGRGCPRPITEYHGKIPEKFIEEDDDSPFLEFELEREGNKEDDSIEGEEMVEAIVTIGNGIVLLKAKRNPFLNGDRGFVAYPHDNIPNAFWGRGVCDKGFNAQSALDAELRARIDALGLLTYPIIGADATRLPRNINLQLTPGKVLLTNGRPSEIIEPLTFGNLNPATFQQTGGLERMVQQATGAVDPATPIDVNTRNATASGACMVGRIFVKRAKMTMHNVDALFLDPLIRKSLLAYRQFDPNRYPIDVEFTVNSTMSIMAREFEQTQMTNLLSIIPQESRAFTVVLKAIIESYSGPSKDKILKEIDQMLQPQQQDPMQMKVQQLALQNAQAEIAKLGATVQKLLAEVKLTQAKTITEMVKADFADDEMEIKAAQTVIEDKKTRVQEAQLQNQTTKMMHDTQIKREQMQHQKEMAKEKNSASKNGKASKVYARVCARMETRKG